MQTTKFGSLCLSTLIAVIRRKGQGISMLVNQDERISSCPPTEIGHKQIEQIETE